MASLNKVMLIGNLGRDPEMKQTTGGQNVTTFSLATTRKWADKTTGEMKEDTQWHNIKVWGKLAETAQKYLTKGKQVYIEGRIETRQYDDKDGNKKYFTEIIAYQFLMLGSKSDDQGSGANSQAEHHTQPPPTQTDDIPF